jgi:DNA-binding NarL/FixJ family response regulator
MIARVLDEARDPVARAKIIPAYIEIMLATGETKPARDAAGELSAIADNHDAELLRALAHQGHGAVLLAEGQPHNAVEWLRRAWSAWQELDVRYEAARVRVLIGLACRALGDEQSAALDLDAARHAFQELGATPDLLRAESLLRQPEGGAGGLTPREVDVLRLIAAGKTNRAIGDELVISEKTVARHVSNILTKLGVPSRAAATAFAYDHHIV